MTPKQLKNSILQRAIEGRLVPQYADDGTADELLAQIRAEKEQIIADGKIKREKPLPPIDESELPFAIPASWRWVRLGDVVKSISDIDHKMPETVEFNGVPYISPLNFTENGIDYNSAKKISEYDYIRLSRKCCPEKGDIIFPRYGTIGIIRRIDTDIKLLVSYSCCVIKTLKKYISDSYFWYVLKSNLTQIEIHKYINKTTQPNVGLTSIKKFLFPLPPLAEQRRIVAKIDELMTLLDRYERAYNELTALDAKFPDALKKSLLQYAIQGRLVPQCAADGTADELLAQIRAEKEQLIADGKIKREKPLPPIDESELPFAIPASWRWVRLGEVSTYGQKKNKILVKNISDNDWILDLEDIEKETGRIIKYKEGRMKKIVGDKITFNEYDILYSKLRPYLKKVLVAPNSGICTPELVPFRCYGEINHYYVTLLLKSNYVNDIANSESYGVKMPRVGTETMQRLLIPLPPLAEQHRIARKIDELMAQVGRLAKGK